MPDKTQAILSFDPNGIFNNFVFQILWSILAPATLFVLNRLKSIARPTLISFRLQILLLFSFSTLSLSAFFLLRDPHATASTYAFPALITSISAIAIWWLLDGFRVAQISAAFPKTKSGISYSESLKLVHNSLDFMGIGAAKLTSDPEFSKALERCAGVGATTTTVRLLLASPDHPVISRSEKTNNALNDEYKTNVNNSLGKIALLVKSKALKVEVRHYNATLVKDYPQFRLMFIDGEICIFSWNVWDHSKGENNPQLVLRKGHRQYEQSSLYKSYHKYFTDLWESGTPIDLGNIP